VRIIKELGEMQQPQRRLETSSRAILAARGSLVPGNLAMLNPLLSLHLFELVSNFVCREESHAKDPA